MDGETAGVREIAQVIQEWIDKQPGRTIADLSRASGVTPTTLHDIVKRRKKFVRPDTLAKITEVTGSSEAIDAAMELDNSDPLSVLIYKAMRKAGLSYRQVAARATAKHHPITAAAVNNLVTGKTHQPSDSTLRAIAAGIPGLTYASLLVAYEQSERRVKYELPERAKYLTQEQFEAVIAVVDSLLATRRRP